MIRTGLFKAGLKFEYRCKSLKTKFSFILFIYNLIAGRSEKNRKKIYEKNKRKGNPEQK